MNDLVDFLRARLAEDEQAALGAKGDTPGRWEDKSDPATWIVLYDQSGKLTMGQHRHIARHDPARVLRDVEAKRRIVDEIARGVEYEAEPLADGILWSLAQPYADHPDYPPEWAPTAPACS